MRWGVAVRAGLVAYLGHRAVPTTSWIIRQGDTA